jgi:hypothetical protein
MPLIPKGKRAGVLEEVSPEDALAQGLCPETGLPLEGRDIEGWIGTLWPRTPSEEAARRIGLLRDFAKSLVKSVTPETPTPPRARAGVTIEGGTR